MKLLIERNNPPEDHKPVTCVIDTDEYSEVMGTWFKKTGAGVPPGEHVPKVVFFAKETEHQLDFPMRSIEAAQDAVFHIFELIREAATSQGSYASYRRVNLDNFDRLEAQEKNE